MTARRRPLTSDERKQQQRSGSAAQKRSALMLFGVVSGFVIMMLYAGIFLAWKLVSRVVTLPDVNEVAPTLLLAITAVVLVLGLLVLKREYGQIKSPGSYSSNIDADLRAGVAVVEVLDVDEVYEIEEVEDEGPGFLMSLRDGRVLFLVDQDFCPYSLRAGAHEKEFAETVFPNRKVEHTYAPNSGVVFSTKGLGDYLKPKAVLQWPEPKAMLALSDGFMDGPLDDIVRRIGFVQAEL